MNVSDPVPSADRPWVCVMSLVERPARCNHRIAGCEGLIFSKIDELKTNS
jgi:hypothetical protein